MGVAKTDVVWRRKMSRQNARREQQFEQMYI